METAALRQVRGGTQELQVKREAKIWKLKGNTDIFGLHKVIHRGFFYLRYFGAILEKLWPWLKDSSLRSWRPLDTVQVSGFLSILHRGEQSLVLTIFPRRRCKEMLAWSEEIYHPPQVARLRKWRTVLRLYCAFIIRSGAKDLHRRNRLPAILANYERHRPKFERKM